MFLILHTLSQEDSLITNLHTFRFHSCSIWLMADLLLQILPRFEEDKISDAL